MAVQHPDLFAFQRALDDMLFSERFGRMRLLEESVRRRVSTEFNVAWPDLLLFITQADLDRAQFGGDWKRFLERTPDATGTWHSGVDACIAELEKSLQWTLEDEVRLFVGNAVANLRALRAVGPKP